MTRTPDVIDYHLPAEPAAKTVVVDTLGIAWQRLPKDVATDRDRWSSVDLGAPDCVVTVSWPELVDRGRLVVVWRPGEST